MYGLIGSFKAASGKRDELIAILLSNVETMPGCRSYVVAEDPTDPQTIWVTEVWDDEASHKASLQLAAVKAAVARACRSLHPSVSTVNSGSSVVTGSQGRLAARASNGVLHLSPGTHTP